MSSIPSSCIHSRIILSLGNAKVWSSRDYQLLTISTSAATVISMICVSLIVIHFLLYPSFMLTLQWLVMPNNLIFMGLHFVISKCALHSDEMIMTDSHYDLQCMRIPCWPRTYSIYLSHMCISDICFGQIERSEATPA
jgi:hypothetical protein